MDLESLPPDPDPAAPAMAAPAAGTPGRRRRPLLLAGAGAALALAVGGFAVGSALADNSSATVQLANTAASNGTTSPTSGTNSGPRMMFRGRGAAGKVTGINGTSLTVSTPRGTVTVQTDGSTTYAMEATGKVSDAKVGARVLVHGTAGATNTIAAQQLVLLPALPKRPALPSDGTAPKFAPHFGTPPTGTPSTGTPSTGGAPAFKSPASHGLGIGTVASNDGSTLKITNPAGTTITVTTDGKTVVLETVSASFGSIKVGDVVAVAGPAPSGQGTAPKAPTTPPTAVTASHINIVPAALVAGSLHAGGFATFPAIPFAGRGFGRRFGHGLMPGSTGTFQPGGPGPAAGQSTGTNV